MPSGNSKVTFKMKGTSSLVRLASAASAQARAAVKGVITTYAIRIERKLKKELATAGSGKTYTRGGVTHTASAPGESPASDTGRYRNNIRRELGRLAAKVVADVEYAAPLEYGTSDIEPRPMWRPIIKEEIPRFRGDIVNALDQVL